MSTAMLRPLHLALGSVGLLIFSATSLAETPQTTARMLPENRKFLETHCFECHNADKQKGKVRLDDLALEITEIPTAERWQKVLAALNSGEMPPEDAKQPSAPDKAGFLEKLSKQMVIARKALSDSGGVITMRRLNRREYVYTIRELLDVEVNPFDLPSDEAPGTFDTVGSGLFFSSDQFAQYLKLARNALDQAIVTGKPAPKQQVRIEVEQKANESARTDLKAARASIQKVAQWRKSGGTSPEFNDEPHASTNESLARGRETVALAYLKDPATLTGRFPKLDIEHFQIPGNLPPGRYILRARVAFPPDAPHVSNLNMTPLLGPRPWLTGGEPRFVEFGTQGDQGWPIEMKLLGCHQVKGTLEKAEIIEQPVVLTKGSPRIFALRERRPNGQADLNYFWYYKAPQRSKHEFGFWRGLWIDWVEWEGPLETQWPPESHQLALGEVDLTANPGDEQARDILQNFASRAFRGRQPTADFMERLMGHFAERRKAGEPFEQAIKTPLAIILASPKFLYIVEPVEREALAVAQTVPASFTATPTTPPAASPAGATKRVPLSDAELANRLSYFLWSSPPDERLLSFASSGKLKDPKVLAAEANRMLADEKVMRFVSGFTHQWLHMTRLDFFQFNWRLYPLFDGSLKAAARREVFETLRTVLDENLPLGTLLKSDFVVVNDILADFYDIPGVEGSAFRKVSVPAGIPRGGLLSMAAILAMGSDGERSSLVERGAWVLRKLLHDPPPPAPANVPQLSRFAGKLLPARELMTAHQEQPQCAQCHRRIDPIGFALEHFDATGRWRTEEYTEVYKIHKAVEKKQFFPIDSSGRLPDGTPFDGFEGLRDAVAKHEANFARGLTEHLVEYALGRPCGFSDAELVETVLQKSKPQRYTPRSLIQALIASKEFQSK
ncbi:MAG: hypothetical protein RLZZ399_647 [Verrucomicrobiota bacterium]|jgi:hypothetical protein